MARTIARIPRARNAKFCKWLGTSSTAVRNICRNIHRLAKVYWQPWGQRLERRREEEAGEKVPLPEVDGGQLQVLPALAQPEADPGQEQDGEVAPLRVGQEGVEELAGDEREERRQEERGMHRQAWFTAAEAKTLGLSSRTLGGFS